MPVLFAITVHEVAHGWVARQLGDRTAQMMGRLTLNPIKHIDPVGTLLVPAVLLLMGGILLGWAKPVPVVVRNLRRPKRDMAIVAAAGPAANLLMALGWAVVTRLAVDYHLTLEGDTSLVALFVLSAGVAGVFINTVLMVLNLLPIPPLDGGRVLAGMLPAPLAGWFERVEPFGLIIVLVLLVSGGLAWLMLPAVNLVLAAILDLVQVSMTDYVQVYSMIRPRLGS
ncbi:MAG TPA: site-2 protease family protein [Steroidobacteraceae bacterium]|nr:site-2 protease family protein [Steroidobacteraceae bacterium]